MRACAVVAGGGSLTPLAPISIQEMKLGAGLGIVLEAPGLSPYHTGRSRTCLSIARMLAMLALFVGDHLHMRVSLVSVCPLLPKI